MNHTKITVTIKTTTSKWVGTFESGLKHAKTPATPLKTVTSAAAYLARAAEMYEGGGDLLIEAVTAAVREVRTSKT